MTDGQLLDNFGFGELVMRYGPAVFRRCRKVLANEQDAEDACQDSFQVLHRRASSLRKSDSLGSWLLGVAYRLAVRMRRRAVMHRRLERSRVGRPYEGLRQEDSSEEEGRVVREEVDRMPGTYRWAVLIRAPAVMNRHSTSLRLLSPPWQLLLWSVSCDREPSI